MNKNPIFLPLTALLFCFCFCHAAYAKEKVVIVTVNTSNPEDILNDHGFRKFADEGVFGLINTKSSGSNNQYKPYLTIGSGQKSDVYAECIDAVKINQNTKARYNSLTLHPAQDGEIACIWINRIKDINKKNSYNAQPGKLADILKSNNIRTGFIGGYLDGGSIKSPAFFICMDSFGLADSGEIDGVFNHGLFDYNSVYDSYLQIKDTADFIVIELGELESLYSERRLYNSESYNAKKTQILKNCSDLTNRIKSDMDFDRSMLCIISPYSYDTENKNSDVLCPVIFYDGGKSKGIAYSKTTRRQGIVSSLDIAPTIIKYFKIPKAGFIGYPIEYSMSNNSAQYVGKLYNDTRVAFASRLIILKGFALLVIITLLIYAFLLLLFGADKCGIIYMLMVFFMFVPFSMLVEGLFRFGSLSGKIIFIVLISAFMTAMVYRFLKRPLNRVLAIASLNLSILIIDLLTGQNMQKYSILSYDPIVGARYYGIGNEYLGVLISCSLIISNYLMHIDQRFKKPCIIVLCFICLLTGLPWLGANVGGVITAAAGFLIFMVLYYDPAIKKAFIYAAIGMVVSFSIVLVFNLLSENFESHLGNMVYMIKSSGLEYAVNIISRKAAMSMKLIRYTIWSRVFIIILVTAVVLFVKPGNNNGKFFSPRESTQALWISSLLSCVTAIIFNDSGIVTAAILMLYVFMCSAITYKGN